MGRNMNKRQRCSEPVRKASGTAIHGLAIPPRHVRSGVMKGFSDKHSGLRSWPAMATVFVVALAVTPVGAQSDTSSSAHQSVSVPEEDNALARCQTGLDTFAEGLERLRDNAKICRSQLAAALERVDVLEAKNAELEAEKEALAQEVKAQAEKIANLNTTLQEAQDPALRPDHITQACEEGQSPAEMDPSFFLQRIGAYCRDGDLVIPGGRADSGMPDTAPDQDSDPGQVAEPAPSSPTTQLAMRATPLAEGYQISWTAPEVQAAALALDGESRLAWSKSHEIPDSVQSRLFEGEAACQRVGRALEKGPAMLTPSFWVRMEGELAVCDGPSPGEWYVRSPRAANDEHHLVVRMEE